MIGARIAWAVALAHCAPVATPELPGGVSDTPARYAAPVRREVPPFLRPGWQPPARTAEDDCVAFGGCRRRTAQRTR